MKYWTTKEGERIAIKDMTTSHLKNTINFIDKLLPSYKNEYNNMIDDSTSLEGEMVFNRIELDLKRTIDYLTVSKAEMEKELSKRQ